MEFVLLPRAFSSRHTKPYHTQHSLLLQFILSELILAHVEVQGINHAINSWAANSKINRHQASSAILSHLSKLAGSFIGSLRLLAWQEDGILAKMNHYCNLLMSDRKDHLIGSLIREIGKLGVLCVKMTEQVNVSTNDSEPFSDLISKIQEEMNREMGRIEESTRRAFSYLKEDENAIFFILRHYKELSNIYGKIFTDKLLKKLLPAKKQTGEFLKERYLKRGFSHLLPLIDATLVQMQLS